MPSQYRILISSVDAFGHINCTLGFGELLKDRGHEVIFAHRKKYQDLATKRGFKFIPYDEEIFGDAADQAAIDWVNSNMEKFRKNALERYQGWTQEDKEKFALIAENYKLNERALTKILATVEIDLILGDFVARHPFLYKSKVPYIPLCSMNPLMLYPGGPPAFSGYSVNIDPETARIYRQAYADATSVFDDLLGAWLTENGVPITGNIWGFEKPKYIGFYHFPGALDYEECGPKRDNWICVDSAIRQPDGDQFTVPKVLDGKPGRLIYFSLGSLGSADVQLMRRLIAILAKSPHRFIVSKGPKGDEIDLPDNMWGENYVNQIKVLQVVDMVITHGGNNTFLESIYYNQPLIVIPFFFDQIDNAQRVVDKKIGRRIDPWDLKEEQLLSAIEEILADEEIKLRIKSISDSMRNSDTRRKAAEMVEELIKNDRSRRGNTAQE